MEATELKTLQKFIKHLALDEYANGSDKVAQELEEMVKCILPWNTVEDVAEFLHNIYFNDALELIERHTNSLK